MRMPGGDESSRGSRDLGGAARKQAAAGGQRDESEARRAGDEQRFPVRREQQKEPLPLDQSGIARNAEREQIEPENDPPVALPALLARRQIQGKPDQPGDPRRRNPQPGRRVEILERDRPIPAQVAPEDALRSLQGRKLTEHEHDLRLCSFRAEIRRFQ